MEALTLPLVAVTANVPCSCILVRTAFPGIVMTQLMPVGDGEIIGYTPMLGPLLVHEMALGKVPPTLPSIVGCKVSVTDCPGAILIAIKSS
jgi:hypothetical protein